MRWTADVISYCKLRYQKYQLRKLPKFTSVAPLQTGKILKIFLPKICSCFVCPRLKIGDGYNSSRMSCGFKYFIALRHDYPYENLRCHFKFEKHLELEHFYARNFPLHIWNGNVFTQDIFNLNVKWTSLKFHLSNVGVWNMHVTHEMKDSHMKNNFM